MRTVEEWLGKDNQLAIDIWNKKYKFENETFEEWLDRVSGGDNAIKRLMREKRFLFGGRILANRGLQNYGKKVTYSNCYVLGINDDSIEAIYQTCADLARTFSYGGGVGIDISPLRAKGMKVNNAAKTTTGAVSFMNTFSNVSEVIGQNGRRGATMISIDCHHPDLEEFINIKNDLNAVTKANISVRITDDFMAAVVNKRDWDLFFETEDGDVLVKTVKAHEIFRLLAKNNWSMAEPGILFWDRIENYNLLSEDPDFHYAGVNPCAEEPLPNGGSCLLGSFNLVEYYDDFTKSFDFQKFIDDIPVVVKAMNDVLDEGLPLHPLQIQRETVRDYRQIGIGMMGLADLLIKLEIRYDSDEAIALCDEIGYTLAKESIRASALLAKEYGAYPKCNREKILKSEFLVRNTDSEVYALVQQYGLRNSQLLTIAPTGTLSTMLGISGGVEPIFSFSYSRKTQSLHGEDVYYKVFTPIAKEYMEKHGLTEEEDLPDFFVTSQTINPFKRVKIQAAWQNHIDASISSTINLPNDTTIDVVEDLYIAAWYEGLKGLTIFRDGCDRAAVLTTEKPKEEKKEEKPVQPENLLDQMNKGLKFGDTIMPSDDVIGLKKTIKSGCGTLHLNAYFDEETGELREVFLSKGSKGGCLAFTNAVSRLLSLLARKGATIEEIVDQLNSVVVCPSYVSARAAGKEVSPGTSCASSIAKALLEMHEKFQKYYMDNDEEDEEEVPPQKVQIDKERITKEVKGPEYATCPECGKKSLMFSGGCNSCVECGYTKCN
jgi:ribonucleoside-diphosphate reductase alpha chain